MFCCCRDKPANSGGGDVPLPPPKDGKGEKIDTRQFTDAPITHPVETQPIRIGPESTEKREALEISAKSQQSEGRLVKEVKEEAVAKTVASSQSVAPSQTQSQNSSQARRPQQSQSPSQSESDMKHQTVINVGGSNPGVVNPSSPPEPSQAMTETERTILSEIDKLAGAVDSVEGAAAMSRADAKKCASVYANQLVALTSQVRKEAEKMSEAGLQTAVERLEKVAARLETLASQSGRSAGGGDTDEVNPFVTAFDDLVGAAFAKYVSCSAAIGGDVKKQADLVEAAFREQRQFLVVASKSKAPSQDAMMSVVKPMAAKIQAVQDFRENNRRSEFFNHLSAISESIAAFGWIAVSPAPGPYVKEMMDSGTFYTNRVLKDYKEKDPKHVEWVKSWLAVLNPLQDYIKEFHRTGVTWNPKVRAPNSLA
ncbi:hypothetical protein BaRGS_00033181 [Batillaria attramentaria]|uniref:CAP N-terminal domain-containing protein n=1 Tax=Batillaria attramentaria TaxID=370345 RepID=A0ABD0JM93_9CAEN